jgi:lipid-binding SYLF domain-containing protein
MKFSYFGLIVAVLFLGLSTASADEGKSEQKQAEQKQEEQKQPEQKPDELSQEVAKIKKQWQEKDDSFDATLKKAYGYAIFPEVGKGGFIVGAAHGKGEVYEKGKLIGHVKMTQTTIGAQVGGQTFAEVILFKNKKALDRFKNSRFEGSAAATAIGGKSGAAAASKYKDGVAIMVLPLKGAMAEAAGGGQKFKFEPLGKK